MKCVEDVDDTAPVAAWTRCCAAIPVGQRSSAVLYTLLYNALELVDNGMRNLESQGEQNKGKLTGP